MTAKLNDKPVTSDQGPTSATGDQALDLLPAVIGLEPRPVGEAAQAAHDRDQDRRADLGEPGQRPGELAKTTRR